MQSEDDDPVSINVWRPVETVLTSAARLAWPAFQAVNRRIESSSFQPKWAPAPLMKSHERSKPQLGWPRTTDSLCPTCVKEARARILSGERCFGGSGSGRRLCLGGSEVVGSRFRILGRDRRNFRKLR